MNIFKHALIAFVVAMLSASTAWAQDTVEADDARDQRIAQLDAVNPQMIQTLQRFLHQETAVRNATGSVIKPNTNYIRGVQWPQNMVTVAFNGGDDATRRAIEDAAAEWTRHSTTFRFNFRTLGGQFRTWSTSDTAAAADIRISFDGSGYWSDVGRVATSTLPEQATMNLGGVEISTHLFISDRSAWLRTYEYSTILHEFGHALGLSHEHFHEQCQDDIIFDPAPGYIDRYSMNGRLRPDTQGRTPGALRYFRSTGWDEHRVAFNLKAEVYYNEMLGFIAAKYNVTGTRQDTPAIDRYSVMLYEMPFFVLRGAASSPCVHAGAGPFATQLSPEDIAYFRLHYNRPLPSRTEAQNVLARARAIAAAAR